MAQNERLNDLLKRATRTRGRIIWAAEVRARRSSDQDLYLVFGGPGPVQIGSALEETSVAVPDWWTPGPPTPPGSGS